MRNRVEIACLVAGGVGIAPLYLLAQSLLTHNVKPVLFYGGANIADLVLREYFERLGIEIFYSTEDGSLRRTRTGYATVCAILKTHPRRDIRSLCLRPVGNDEGGTCAFCSERSAVRSQPGSSHGMLAWSLSWMCGPQQGSGRRGAISSRLPGWPGDEQPLDRLGYCAGIKFILGAAENLNPAHSRGRGQVPQACIYEKHDRKRFRLEKTKSGRGHCRSTL